MNEYRTVIRVPAEELKRWDRLLNQKRVNYEQEGFGENRVVFVKTASFPNGLFADIKVCTNLNGEDLYSEMVVYNEHGQHVWLSSDCSVLSGEWRVGGWDSGSEVYYQVTVEPEDPEAVYGKLGIARDEFCSMVRHELENGVTTEYSERIAESISDAVAEDVHLTADPKEWNVSDIRLGTGRALIDVLHAEA